LFLVCLAQFEKLLVHEHHMTAAQALKKSVD